MAGSTTAGLKRGLLINNELQEAVVSFLDMLKRHAVSFGNP